MLKILALGFVFAHVAFSQVILPVDKGTFTLTLSPPKPAVVGNYIFMAIEGTIHNDTTFDYTHVDLEFTGYDAGGVDLKLCEQSVIGQKCVIHISDPLLAGQSVQFKDLLSLNAGRAAKMVGGRGVYRVAEAPRFVKYKVESTPFVTEKVTISPALDTRGIALEFRSTSDVVEVLWDQSVYIDETGNASRLIRSNVRLVEKDRPQPNTVVPPGAKLRETVFPIDRIKQDKDGSSYQIGLFPETVENGSSDKPALGFLVGKEVRLFLRLLINDQKQNVTIPFKIVQVD